MYMEYNWAVAAIFGSNSLIRCKSLNEKKRREYRDRGEMMKMIEIVFERKLQHMSCAVLDSVGFKCEELFIKFTIETIYDVKQIWYSNN